ncbi:MAG: DUF116 domain-containing protein [Holophagales bacterium]|jgi:hypothetical protein|nr:DUF116 domain-containing protein [Holophagales bacterium]
MNTTPTFFLMFRRGIPLIGIALSLMVIWIYPASLGWALLAAVALAAEAVATFGTGGSYLVNRQTTIRWDGYWLQVLRPLFKSINLEDPWLRSFCAWNNRRVSSALSAKKAHKVILLLPHCIQLTKCKSHVVENLQSCFRCGKCVVENAATAALKYNWDVRISPRSRAAYAEARKSRPSLIIAIACPDRLVKGVTKLSEIPSYTIPLEMPHGMCVDTTFDFHRLSQAMITFAELRSTSKIQPLQINTGTWDI